MSTIIIVVLVQRTFCSDRYLHLKFKFYVLTYIHRLTPVSQKGRHTMSLCTYIATIYCRIFTQRVFVAITRNVCPSFKEDFIVHLEMT